MRSLIWTLQWLLYYYVFLELHWCGSLASIKKQSWNLRRCGYRENMRAAVISVSLDLLGNHNKWTELLASETRGKNNHHPSGSNEKWGNCTQFNTVKLSVNTVLETVTAENCQYWDKQKKAYKYDSCSSAAEPSYFSDLCAVSSVFPMVFVNWWASSWCLSQKSLKKVLIYCHCSYLSRKYNS